MIIRAELKCKQAGCEANPCAVDKVIELPSPRFQQFSRALLADYDFIAENKNAIRHDDDSRHCLLILDAEGKDGFLVDPQGHNYARYSAFVPNARSLLTPDMGIDRSYLSPAEPWRNENRDEILRMTLRVDGKPDYESVMYLAEHEITQGTGNGCFSPDAPVTVRQWAMMLCRAYDVKVEGSSWGDLSQSAVEQSYRKGWLNEPALSAPNIQLCRGALLKSAFAAAKIPVYDSVLYAGGVSLPDHENCIRIGKELQLCGEEDDANEIVTRRDAAMLLHVILTRAFAVTAPAAPVTLVNAAGVNINDYLLALRQVPEQIGRAHV